MALGLLLQVPALAFAEGTALDTLRLNVLFERGESVLNKNYHGNQARIRAFETALKNIGTGEIVSARISAGASPVGNTDANKRLSEARTQSLSVYFDTAFSPIGTTGAVNKIMKARGEDWDGLAIALESVNRKWAPQALDIVRNTPVWVLNEKNVVVDSRKRQLMNLAGGTAWKYLRKNVFPEVCSGGEIVVVYRPGEGVVAPEESELVSTSTYRAETDTLEIRFRLDAVDVDLDYAQNRARVSDFFYSVSKDFDGKNPEALQWDIYAGASPEGPAKHNEWLGMERGNSIRSLIRDSLGVKAGTFVIHNSGARWDDLYRRVARSDEPWKADVLRIIRKSPSADREARDRREVMLRSLHGGKVWPVLLNKYMAPLRSGGSAVVTYHPERDTIPAEAVAVAVPDVKVNVGSGQAKVETYRHAPIFRPAVYASSTVSDTLDVKFRLDSTRIDFDFDGNRMRIEKFVNDFNTHYAGYNPAALQLDIYAGASPEGTGNHNHWLGKERGNAIRRLVRDSLHLRTGNIFVHNLAARWDDFYDMIWDSKEPWRDEVLAIISQEPSPDGRYRDHREAKLRALRGGTVWPVLLEKYLAPLRSGATAIVTYIPEKDVNREESVTKNYYFLGNPFGNQCCPADKFRFYGFPPVFYPGTTPPAATTEETKPKRKEKGPAEIYPAWAVKTNLLFWGVVAPNVQVEFPIGRKNRWSIEWEYDHPWFIWNTNSQASQILNMSLELRLYLGNRVYHRWLDGWHIGIAVGGGKYDWEWKQHEGWQGEFINAYFNVGYQHRFGKHWAVDAGLGVGVIPSRYRHYYGGSVYPDNHLEPWDVHLIYHDKGHFFYPGATHVNVSISYMFNNWPIRFKTMRGRKLERWTEERTAEIQRQEMRRQEKIAQREAKLKAKDEREAAREFAKEQKKTARKAKSLVNE